MHDPLEGVTSRGTIMTGASRTRVPALYEPLLAAAAAAVRAAERAASLYVYGSVATGTAHVGISDVDLLTVGIAPKEAAAIGQDLSVRFADLCRGVGVAAAQPSDFAGETDAAYGGRVFLRHYCVHLDGPDLRPGLPEFAADARAARGFNGDIAEHADRWRTELESGGDLVRLARRLARKTLFALAGMVSVHDETWTTDRRAAATRWAEIDPSLTDDLRRLLGWSENNLTPDRESVAAALEGVVTGIAASFENLIGLWNSSGEQ